MQRFTFSENCGKTRFMGIINISPDSFYEQSRCNTTDEVLATAEKMTREGADFLDLGAESSRPGSKPISEQEEIDKLIPVISSLVKIIDIPISVDTYKPIVAKEALKAGAKIIDVGGESTRPGSKTISAKTEWKRIEHVLKNFKKNYKKN